jgi:hypothetical protein
LRTKEIPAKWHLNENSDMADFDILQVIQLPFSKEFVKEAFVYPYDGFPPYKEMDKH